MSLDRLAHGDRRPSYDRIVDFLEIEDERPMRRFFRREITAENANRGRWRQGLSPDDQWEVNTAYERALEAIEAEGFASAPLLREVYDSDARD